MFLQEFAESFPGAARLVEVRSCPRLPAGQGRFAQDVIDTWITTQSGSRHSSKGDEESKTGT